MKLFTLFPKLYANAYANVYAYAYVYANAYANAYPNAYTIFREAYFNYRIVGRNFMGIIRA